MLKVTQKVMEPKPRPAAAIPSFHDYSSLCKIVKGALDKVIMTILEVTNISGKKLNKKEVVWTFLPQKENSKPLPEAPPTTAKPKTKKIQMTILSVTTPDGRELIRKPVTYECFYQKPSSSIHPSESESRFLAAMSVATRF